MWVFAGCPAFELRALLGRHTNAPTKQAKLGMSHLPLKWALSQVGIWASNPARRHIASHPATPDLAKENQMKDYALVMLARYSSSQVAVFRHSRSESRPGVLRARLATMRVIVKKF